MQGGDRRPEKGQVGNYGNVDSGEMAGMPKDQKPPSSSPTEQHSDARDSKHSLCMTFPSCEQSLGCQTTSLCQSLQGYGSMAGQ